MAASGMGSASGEGGGSGGGDDKAQRRLGYLMAQSEMFAHFLGAQVCDGGRERRRG